MEWPGCWDKISEGNTPRSYWTSIIQPLSRASVVLRLSLRWFRRLLHRGNDPSPDWAGLGSVQVLSPPAGRAAADRGDPGSGRRPAPQAAKGIKADRSTIDINFPRNVRQSAE